MVHALAIILTIIYCVLSSMSLDTVFVITTIAGNGGTGAYGGDNGQATSATLNYPYGVAVESSGTSITNDTIFYYVTRLPPSEL